MTIRPTILTLLLTTTLAAQNPTPTDEHKHWAEVTHKYETAPLDDDADHDATLTVANIAVSDFRVKVCPELLQDFSDSRYTYRQQIRRLYLLGAATYQVESGKTDSQGTSLYALHSVLKGYAAILRQEPDAKDKTLSDLASMDAKNKLADYIARKNCQ